LGWVGLGWVGLGWVGLGWVGLGWVGLGWVRIGEVVSCFITIWGNSFLLHFYSIKRALQFIMTLKSI
jgi:hypothetical protein